MKTPVVFVTAALTAATLLAASLVIATTMRGEDSLWPLAGHAAGRTVPTTPVRN
jgi:hypothetical protein